MLQTRLLIMPLTLSKAILVCFSRNSELGLVMVPRPGISEPTGHCRIYPQMAE
jgi:hypothetical protein